MNVLVVDDDPLACKMLRFMFADGGYGVEAAHSAESAMKVARREDIDLVLLDVMLPRVDGFELYDWLRRDGYHGPVIFLTAMTETHNKLSGLQMGADDYVVKPFEPAELMARVRAVLRRYEQRKTTAADVRLRSGEIVLDVNESSVRLPGMRSAHLTPSEAAVLRCLMEHAGMVVPRENLSSLLWGDGGNGCAEQISVYVRRLRKKIEPDPSRPKYIQSVRSRGYRFSSP